MPSVPAYPLNDGSTIPGLGLGTYPMDDTEAERAVDHALRFGYRLIDTAAAYGFGHSEGVVGRALEGLQSARTCSPRPRPWTAHRRVVHSLKRDSILREAQASLKRLGVEVIDLYYQHRVDRGVPIEETVGAMARLVQQGKVRHRSEPLETEHLI